MTTSDIRGVTGRPGRAAGAPREVASQTEDLVTVLLSTALVCGVMTDVWAHINIIETIESFFTPWHGLLYTGFAATAAWTLFLAHRRRADAPRWWFDGWPAGYRVGALGAGLFLFGGFADMVWHQTFGIETGLKTGLSPSHLLLDFGGVLLVTSPLRSWWASRAGGARAATGIASAALATVTPTVLLISLVAFTSLAPTRTYLVSAAAHEVAVRGYLSYLLTTVLLLVPILLIYRRRIVPGTATAIVGSVGLFTSIVFEFPGPQTVAALGATLGAAIADALLYRLDARRGPDAPLRLPIAGALVAALTWTGHLVGLHVAAGVRWPVELWSGTVVMTSLLAAALGGLAARPADLRD